MSTGAAAAASAGSLPSPFPESLPVDATGPAAAVAVLLQATASTFSVPWLLLAMPLPRPVAGLDGPRPADREGGGGAPDGSTSRTIDPSSDRSPRCCSGDLSENPLESSENAGDFAAGAADHDELSLRFVCHVEAARLLATTAMGVLGDDDRGGYGGCEGGEEECARVLQAGEAFFAAFERSYGG